MVDRRDEPGGGVFRPEGREKGGTKEELVVSLV